MPFRTRSNREVFANTVYLGLADPIHGPVTPGNRTWYSPNAPRHPFDQDRARSLLAELGLVDRDEDGQLEDAAGADVRFTLLTQRGNTARERATAVLQEDLVQVGLGVDVVPLEFGALIERIMQADYDAVYFGTVASDTDPAVNLDYWLSSGAFHPWNPRQTSPATEWEARIDALMERQVASRDRDERIRLFADVQGIFGEFLPAVYFSAPHAYFAAGSRVRGIQPRLQRPHILWNADSLYTATPGDGTR